MQTMDVMDAARRVFRTFGFKSMAVHLGKSETTLRHELDRHCKHAKLGLLDSVAATQESGDPSILIAFAFECGYTVTPIDQSKANAGDARLSGKPLSRALKEIGEYVVKVADTGDDGVSDNDLRDIDQELCEAIRAIQQVQVDLRARNLACKPAALRSAA